MSLIVTCKISTICNLDISFASFYFERILQNFYIHVFGFLVFKFRIPPTTFKYIALHDRVTWSYIIPKKGIRN